MPRRPHASIVTLLTASSALLAFGPLASSAARPAPAFAVVRMYDVGSSPRAALSRDLNGDGRADLATANADAGTVSVLLSKGNAGFRPPRAFRAGDYPVAVAAGDLSGADGHPDLVVANLASDTISVLRGRGDGSFTPKRDFGVGSAPVSVAVGDLDADGRLDVATANRNGTVSVLVAAGKSFRRVRDHRVGRSPAAVVIRDLNGDGRGDLVTANSRGGSLSVLLNRGKDVFARRDYPLDGEPTAVAVGDLNHDDRPDLAAVSRTGGLVSVLLNQGNGSFASGSRRQSSAFAVGIAIADVDDDGHPDLLVAAFHGLSVLLGNGDGTFEHRRNFRLFYPPYGIVTGDFNGDRRADVAFPFGDLDRVLVRLNSTGVCGVPNVLGEPLARARRLLEQAGCRVGKIGGALSRYDAGRIVSVSPPYGAVLPQGGRVRLVVSSGRQH